MGHYVAVVWGSADEDLEPLFHQHREDIPTSLRSNYEAPFWLGYEVTVKDRFGRQAPVFQYVVCPLEGILEWVERTHPDSVRLAREQWDAARQKAPWLPEGKLLLVADYD